MTKSSAIFLGTDFFDRFIMRHLFFITLLILLCIAVIISLTLGRYPVKIGEIFNMALNYLGWHSDSLSRNQMEVLHNILFQIRLPRITAAVLVGAALSVSGTVFQSMFINPLVSPGLLGVLAGASFGAAIGMILSKSWLAVQVGAFSFGAISVGLAVGIAKIYRGDKVLMLILGGIISGSFFTSLLSIVKYLADPSDELPAIVYWLMGGFSMVNGKTVWVVAPTILIGILVLQVLSGYLNVLSMGDEEAKTLGINASSFRMIFILVTTLISGITVAVGGIIGWVGLIIPHIGRMIVGSDNRLLLPASALIGGIYLLVVDDLSRLLFRIEIPIGISTAIVGIPFFALVLKNARRKWN
jgi:iron complex transport system permease protein